MIIAFLKLIRWFHLVVAIVPFLGLYGTIAWVAHHNQVDCLQPLSSVIWLCIGVQLLIATGCVHNDIADEKIDAHNKPITRIVGRIFSVRTSWMIFGLLTFALVLVSIFITNHVMVEWSWIVVLVFVASVAYNGFFKRTPLLGNVWMALMTAGIPLLMLEFASACLSVLAIPALFDLIWIYAGFPAAVIIARELSLDISDYDGDLSDGCQTLPILIGKQMARKVVVFMVAMIIAGVLMLAALRPTLWFASSISAAGLLIYIRWFWYCNTRIEYIRAGRFLWGVMIASIIAWTIATLYHLL